MVALPSPWLPLCTPVCNRTPIESKASAEWIELLRVDSTGYQPEFLYGVDAMSWRKEIEEVSGCRQWEPATQVLASKRIYPLICHVGSVIEGINGDAAVVDSYNGVQYLLGIRRPHIVAGGKSPRSEEGPLHCTDFDRCSWPLAPRCHGLIPSGHPIRIRQQSALHPQRQSE